MNKLPKSLVNKANQYSELSDTKKSELLDSLYNDYSLSWSNIAKLCGTYPNKVRRDAKSFDIESRSKSEAQSLALKTGRHSHPTKDKGHSEETKIQISDKVADIWDSLSENEKSKRRLDALKRWNEKSPEEIAEFRRASIEAIRTTAKEGSALEKYLLENLIKKGYKVEFHKEQWVEREKLQIDLLVPELNLAIEVDGPSHFEDIWGKEVLMKNKQRDREKNGLLLRQGFVIIRIRQGRKSLSEKFKRDTLKSLLEKMKEISIDRPKVGNRLFIIGDTND
jgi:very-short-patch-repair endonuclease